MAINKKLIHFNSKDNFMSVENGVNNSPETPTGGDGTYGQIKGTSIVFIKDSKEIWTHGNLYKSVNWSVLEEQVKLITFTISNKEHRAEEGMTWGEWVNSQYNTEGCYIAANNRDVYKGEGKNLLSITYNYELESKSSIIVSGRSYTWLSPTLSN